MLLNIYNPFKTIRFRELGIVLMIIVYSLIIMKNSPQYIKSDGLGYYAYLPATFIYHDFDYSFMDDISDKYFGGNSHKFRVNIDGKITNLTWPGVSILWIPFFLIAHLLAIIFGLTADGYSLIYQFSILAASFFYLFIGIKFLGRFLKISGFSNNTIFFSQLIIVLASPLIAYSTELVSFTHTYSFSLISIFFFYVRKASIKYKRKYILIAAIVLALISIIRPVNAIIILAIPFLASSKENFFALVKNFFNDKYSLIISLLAFFAILSIVPILFKIQTDHWFIWQYRKVETNEKVGFDFLNPKFFKLLFSYRNGLFIYSPVLFISFLGIIPLFIKNKFESIFLLINLIIVVYILSSWHSWYYGMSFGMRAMIEYLPIFAYLFAILYSSINKKIIKLAIIFTIILLIGHNFIQHYQFRKYIFYWKMDKEIYWHIFLKTDKHYMGYWWDREASYSIPKQLINHINSNKPIKSINIDLEKFGEAREGGTNILVAKIADYRLDTLISGYESDNIFINAKISFKVDADYPVNNRFSIKLNTDIEDNNKVWNSSSINIEAYKWYDLDITLKIKDDKLYSIEIQNKGYGNQIYKNFIIEIYKTD